MNDSRDCRSADDDGSTRRSTSTVTGARAQTNVDFVTALLIITIFFSATLFTPGSPLVESNRSEIDYRLDAQRMLVELTGTIRDDDGQVNASKTAALLTAGSLEPHVSTDDDVVGNLTLRPTDPNSSAALFETAPERTVGPPVPQTATSTATTTVSIDGRGTRLELTLWVDA